MSAWWSFLEGKPTLPNVDCKRPCTMTQIPERDASGLFKGETLQPLQLSKRDKSKFCAGRAFYRCTLLPNATARRSRPACALFASFSSSL
jgi:hypothetical protein